MYNPDQVTYPSAYENEVVKINTQKFSVIKKAKTHITSSITGIIVVYFLPKGPSINLQQETTAKTPKIF